MKSFQQFREAKEGHAFFGPPYDHGWIDEKGRFLRHHMKGTLNHDEVAQHFGKKSEDDALSSGWTRFTVTGNKDFSPELAIQMLLPDKPALNVVIRAMKEWPYEGRIYLDVWDGKQHLNKTFRIMREAITWLNGVHHAANA